MNPHSKNVLKYFISFLLILGSSGLAHACMFPDYNAFPWSSVFHPSLGQKRNWSPLYFHYSRFNPELPQAMPEPDRLRNIQEWRTELKLGVGVSDMDMYEVLYKMPADDFIFGFEHHNFGDLLTNTFLQKLAEGGYQKGSMLYYMYLAKKLEIAPESWYLENWEEGEISAVNDQSQTLTELAEWLKQTNHKFLKSRIAFLLLRQHYFNKPADVVSTYQTCLANATSVVSDWALQYRGFAKWNQGDSIGAMHDFLDCFDRCEEKKKRMIQVMPTDLLLRISESDVSLHYRCLALVATAVQTPGPGMDMIEELYKMQPKSVYLPLLLGRELAKLQVWILGNESFHFNKNLETESVLTVQETQDLKLTPGTEISYQDWSRLQSRGNFVKDVRLLKRLYQFAGNYLPNCGMNQNYAMLYLAHIGLMLQDTDRASVYLSKVSEQFDVAATQQKRVEQVFLWLQTNVSNRYQSHRDQLAVLLRDIDSINNLLLLSYRNLEFSSYQNTDALQVAPEENPFPALIQICTQEFLESKDICTAWLFSRFSETRIEPSDWFTYDYYRQIQFLVDHATDSDVEKLIYWKHHGMPDGLCNYLSVKAWPEDFALADLQGTICVRSNQFEKAFTYFQKIPDGWYDTAYNGNFNHFLKLSPVYDDIPIPRQRAVLTKNASKRQLLEQVIDIKRKIAKGGDSLAIWYYQLANACRNISPLGVKWMLSSFWEYWYQRPWNYQCNKPGEINLIRLADSYFTKAWSLAGSNRELAASCCLMIHVCREVRDNIHLDKSYDTAYCNWPMPFLNQFKTEFSNTEVFQSVSSNCW